MVPLIFPQVKLFFFNVLFQTLYVDFITNLTLNMKFTDIGLSFFKLQLLDSTVEFLGFFLIFFFFSQLTFHSPSFLHYFTFCFSLFLLVTKTFPLRSIFIISNFSQETFTHLWTVLTSSIFSLFRLIIVSLFFLYRSFQDICIFFYVFVFLQNGYLNC